MWRAIGYAASWFCGLASFGATVRGINEAIVINDGLWLQAILHDGRTFLTFLVGVAMMATIVLLNVFSTMNSSQANQALAARAKLGVKE